MAPSPPAGPIGVLALAAPLPPLTTAVVHPCDEPSLEEKFDIVQNAIDLALALGIEQPKVAILSAVETVTSKLRSTLDAAAPW